MPGLSPQYIEMRQNLLDVAPDSETLVPTETLPHVYGVVVDIGFDVLFTMATFSSGRTGLFMSNGGSVADLGEVAEISVLSRGLLRQAEADLAEFTAVESTPPPSFGRVRFTVLTHQGRLGVNVDGPAVLKGQHKLSTMFTTVMAIMQLTQQRTAASEPSGPGESGDGRPDETGEAPGS
jgi:hypothetical protein